MVSDHRIRVEGSLFTSLQESFPALLTTRASKATLVVTSHLIEELAAGTEGHNVLLSGFQHGRNWSTERDRYLELSGGTDVIAVFAGREPPAAWETDHLGVRLQGGHALGQEWFVLALGPSLAVTLCGLDGAPMEATGHQIPPLDEGDRLFDVIWSFDPEVAQRALRVVTDAIAESAPERVAEVRRRLAAIVDAPLKATDVAAAADRLTSGMLSRVEAMRRREKLAGRQVSEAKTAFLARMGHELRNPLNAILGYAQLLELSGEKDDDTAGRIHRAGEHLLSLVDEVLDISQVESGALRVDPTDLPVAEMVLRASELIRTEASLREVELDLGPTGDCPLRVRGDERLVIEILLNLLSNAVKYVDRGGRVVLRSHADGGYCQITVSDTGPGVAAADAERIFEPFERLPATAGKAAGTGLGLALSRTMAHAMDGHVSLESGFGAGASFTLTLPLAEG